MNERESRFHKELKALPLRRAPKTLRGRVMAAVAAEAAKPWWQKTWWTWPAPARLAFALAIAAAAAGALRIGLGAASAGLAEMSAARAVAEAAWLLTRTLWRLGGQPLQAVVVLMAASCAAFGTGLAGLAAAAPKAKHI